jgi:uncharacterized protein with PQ loop repeat
VKGEGKMINFLLNLLPTIAGVLLGICYIPQIRMTYRTKNVEGMSLAFWIILNFALSFLVVNAIVVFLTSGVWGYMVTELFNEGLAFVTLMMVLKYRRKR